MAKGFIEDGNLPCVSSVCLIPSKYPRADNTAWLWAIESSTTSPKTTYLLPDMHVEFAKPKDKSFFFFFFFFFFLNQFMSAVSTLSTTLCTQIYLGLVETHIRQRVSERLCRGSTPCGTTVLGILMSECNECGRVKLIRKETCK